MLTGASPRIDRWIKVAPPWVAHSYGPRHPRPQTARPGPRPRAPFADTGSDALATGPESATHLVDPVEHTPTEPTDYAAITAIYGALLAGTAVTARRKDPIPPHELAALGAASFALSKLVVKEKAESWMRRPFVDEQRRKPKGRRLRYAVGELLLCTRCMGAWSALGLVALRLHSPAAGRTVSTVLAASAGNDVLQASFKAICAHANATEG